MKSEKNASLFKDPSWSSWLETEGYHRKAGLRAWKSFLPRVTSYAAKRNYVDDTCSTISKLSPWMNKGLMSEAEISSEALKKHTFDSVEKFLQEVYWRRYWRGFLSHRPEIWDDYCYQVTHLKKEKELTQSIEKIERGECSVAIMGYFAKQLVNSGYMHNHARMWFAAWWIHVEKLPWEAGADFFLKHLIDGDPAVNTLSWRWVAGLHTQGKHYLARRSNLEKYLHPDLLRQYPDSLELLENPTPLAVRTLPLGEPRTQAPLEELIPGEYELIIFAEDLSISQTIDCLNKQGVTIQRLHLLSDSEVESLFSKQKRTWNKNALQEAVREQEEQGMRCKVYDISSPSFRPNTKSVIVKPEVGYYTHFFEDFIRKHSVNVFSHPEKTKLNSFSKAGFFSYWKKTKKHLFSHA